MTSRAVRMRTLRQAPLFIAAVVDAMAMIVVSDVVRSGTGFVGAVRAHRRPTELNGQQYQEENRKPATHGANSSNKGGTSSKRRRR